VCSGVEQDEKGWDLTVRLRSGISRGRCSSRCVGGSGDRPGTATTTGSFGNTARFATLSGGLSRTGVGGGDGSAGKLRSQHSVLVLIDQAKRHVFGANAA